MNARRLTLLILMSFPAAAGCEQAEAATADTAPANAETATATADTAQAKAETAPAKKDEGGKAQFIDQKCVRCHSVKAEGLDAKSDKPIELPGPGGTYEPTWMKAYLLKNEKIGDKQHPTKLKGEEADQDALVDWVCSLKPKK